MAKKRNETKQKQLNVIQKRMWKKAKAQYCSYFHSLQFGNIPSQMHTICLFAILVLWTVAVAIDVFAFRCQLHVSRCFYFSVNKIQWNKNQADNHRLTWKSCTRKTIESDFLLVSFITTQLRWFVMCSFILVFKGFYSASKGIKTKKKKIAHTQKKNILPSIWRKTQEKIINKQIKTIVSREQIT